MSILAGKHVEFSIGDHLLQGVLHQGIEKQSSCVMLLHPHPLYGGGPNDRVIIGLESMLVSAGFGTFRFGFRGSPSTPEGYAGVAGAVEDTLCAYHLLRSRFEISEVAIVGYSFGGAAALRVSVKIQPACLVTLSASAALVQEDGYSLAGLSRIACDILMFHGSDDMMVPSTDLRLLSDAVGLKARPTLLEDEGHFYGKTLKAVGRRIVDFLAEVF